MDKVMVGLSGLPRVGKDTAALFLERKFDFSRFSFAESLYEEVAEAFGVTTEQLASPEWKTEHREELLSGNCSNDEFLEVFWENAELMGERNSKVTSRRILQLWGTEYRRNKCGDTYWLQKLNDKLEASSNRRIVVTDVRFSNEAAYCYAFASTHQFQKTLLLNIQSTRAQKTNHESDDGLPLLIAPHVVKNNSTMGDFERSLEKLMTHHYIYPRGN